MGNQTDKHQKTSLKEQEEESLIVECERAIIDSLETYNFVDDELSSIPRVVIDIILKYSEHYKWKKWEPTWSTKDNKKSKYFRIYDLYQKQMRLELLNYKGKLKSQFALKQTHFNRFKDPLDENRRIITWKLTIFRYGRIYTDNDCTVIEGCLRIGFVSNIYFKSKKFYKKYNNNLGFDQYLSNGQVFIGLYSHVIFDEDIFGLYKIDANNENKPCLLSNETPIEPGEQFEIICQYDEGKVTIKRLFHTDEQGKPKQYVICFPTPKKRFDKEKWYPMVSINPYKSRFTEIGYQLSDAIAL